MSPTARTEAARLAASLSMLVCVAALGGEPDFPGPPEATVVWVGRAIEVNGMPTQIRRFETDDRMEKVARFYRREWQYGEDGGQGYVESNAMPPWRLITRVEDGYLMTVQYQKGQRGGAWGYLAMGRLPDPDGKPKVPRAAVPAPGKSQVLNEIASEDPGQTGRSTVLVNEKSLRSNVDFYNSHYPGHGWSTEMDRPVPGLDMHVLAFRKRRERVTITLIGDHKGTRIMHHTVKRDLL